MPSSAKPLCVFLAFALAVLAGCGSSDESTGSPSAGLPKEIVIGAAIAKTGYLEPWDSTFAAVEQLVKETNARGGIDGHRVRVIQADTRSDPQQAVLAVQKVIEEGADVLFFSGEALTAAAGSPLAEEHDKLNFAIVNEPGFGPPTTGHLSFSSNPSLLSEVECRRLVPIRQGSQAPVPLPRHVDHLRQGRLLGLPAELGTSRRHDRRLRRFRERRRVDREPGQRAAERRRRRRLHVLLPAWGRRGDQADPGCPHRRPDPRAERLRRHLLGEGHPEH